VQIILTDDFSSGRSLAEQYSIQTQWENTQRVFSLTSVTACFRVGVAIRKDWSVVAHESFHIVWH